MLAIYAHLVTIDTDMGISIKKYTPVVAASLLFWALAVLPVPVLAQSEALDDLFIELQTPDSEDWQAVEKRIWKEWSNSGSDSMDLLLERGRQAIRDGDLEKAAEHLTALTDHAPEFAEGWNARATVFFLMEEYGLSVADIETTLSLNPRHFGALAGLGMIYERVDKPEIALRAYEQALAVHPYRPDVIEAIKRLKEATQGTSL